MIGVLGDKETVCGFRFAGIKECMVTDQSTLDKNIEKMENRIIIVTEDLFEGLDKKYTNGDKIFIKIPGIGKYSAKDHIESMLKEVIGEVKND